MTEPEETAEPAATMDMSEHQRTWRLFLSLVKWHAIGVAGVLLILLMLRTHG
jgi:Bacterial aa3 type cytochrome c oxidase subunit IV.